MKKWDLPIRPPYPVMDAQVVDRLPKGPQWQYEPKWDGFRCLAFREDKNIEVQAKSGKSLTRFFPDIVELLRSVSPRSFIIDSELVIPVGEELSFEELQLRLHPAESRVRKLAASHPAVMVAFDMLVNERAELLTKEPLRERRASLESFHRRFCGGQDRLQLSPATKDVDLACEWFGQVGPGLDGIVAKRLDMEYTSGDRTGMVKYKNIRTADCVVGGFRYLQGQRLVGSLLLGLYDSRNLLHHVGYTSSIKGVDRKKLTEELDQLRQPPGFTGSGPGGRSRWAPERPGDWEPLKPVLVIEVEYDHFTGGRFRHGTHFLRWRPDKDPKQCTFDQLEKGRVSGVKCRVEE